MNGIPRRFSVYYAAQILTREKEKMVQDIFGDLFVLRN
jgi:hypothetical protein